MAPACGWQNRSMPRPIRARIDAERSPTTWRARAARRPTPRVWAVVKANAYGHGIERAYPGLKGADGFALLDLAEAERVRALGWRGPVLLLEGCFGAARPRDLLAPEPLAHGASPEAQIDMLAAHKTRPTAPRLPEDEQRHEPARLRAGRVPIRMAATERADAGRRDHADDALGRRRCRSAASPGIADQRARFDEATRDLPGERSLCNSAATLRHGSESDVRGDWVRPGIMLYGSSPDFPLHSIDDWELRPTMTLRAELIALQDLEAGDSVGYGSSFRAAATDADRRRRLRLRRRLSARRADRHAGAGRRRAHRARRPRLDGHGHGRPDAGARPPASAAS